MTDRNKNGVFNNLQQLHMKMRQDGEKVKKGYGQKNCKRQHQILQDAPSAANRVIVIQIRRNYDSEYKVNQSAEHGLLEIILVPAEKRFEQRYVLFAGQPFASYSKHG